MTFFGLKSNVVPKAVISQWSYLQEVQSIISPQTFRLLMYKECSSTPQQKQT